jgi:hypothetical protein
VLARYERLEAIPDHAAAWDVKVRGAASLAQSLREHRDEAGLYRTLATLRTDVALGEDLDALAWQGARREELSVLAAELGMEPDFLPKVGRWR